MKDLIEKLKDFFSSEELAYFIGFLIASAAIFLVSSIFYMVVIIAPAPIAISLISAIIWVYILANIGFNV